ncbi:lytic murein transglycosylase [Mycolicibacterium vaccae]|uniref:lytic transglycosylase domain-containing protein n=1 Tax=Mycolicibacterium vaccae TaxID=1810 RepID=UPI003CFE4D7B
MRKPAVGVAAVLTPLVLAGAVGASAPTTLASRDAAVLPLAAVVPPAQDPSGPAVVAVARPPAHVRVAASSATAPPPAAVVNAPGTLRIPSMALAAYRNAEAMMASAAPNCGVSWNLLAGIGRVESMHAYGGATDARGTAVRPIYGPALDGTLPGNEVIVQSRTADRVTYARAMGPMQFLPGTWSRYASDGDGDGKADVQNVFDASLAAARYLCSGGVNLRDQSDVVAAILRYNNSMAYTRNVLAWAASYATGVVPVDLPPITGSVPELETAAMVASHLDRQEGLGPGLPRNATGLPADDPLSLIPLMTRTDAASQINTNVPGFVPGQSLGPLPGPASELTAELPAATPPPPPTWVPPWMQPPQQEPECAVFCIKDMPAPAAGPAPALGPVPAIAPVPGLPAGPPAPGSALGPAPGPALAAAGPAEAGPAAPAAPPALGPAPGPVS